jgi:zonadhesin
MLYDKSIVALCLFLTAVSLCIVSGEPHYRSFDKEKIDYQGVCKHLLVEPSTSYTGSNQFHVYLRNEYRGGNNQVSFPKDVIIDVCGDHVEILRDATSSAAVPVAVKV